MPIYEYACDECSHRFERIFMSPDERPEQMECPECGGSEVQRLFSAPSVRVGERGGPDMEAVGEAASGRPELFGRKELNEALKKRS
ncbi:MAG: zinc ribbon domain-containing protein [Anaerolineae bacterium]|jgi:putative FmdB family regulatory protein